MNDLDQISSFIKMNSINRIHPNKHSDKPFQRLIEEEKIRVQNYDRIIFDKVKEAEKSKQAVFNTLPVTNPKIHYLKECIAEADLVLPLLNKVRGKTLCLQ